MGGRGGGRGRDTKEGGGRGWEGRRDGGEEGRKGGREGGRGEIDVKNRLFYSPSSSCSSFSPSSPPPTQPARSFSIARSLPLPPILYSLPPSSPPPVPPLLLLCIYIIAHAHIDEERKGGVDMGGRGRGSTSRLVLFLFLPLLSTPHSPCSLCLNRSLARSLSTCIQPLLRSSIHSHRCFPYPAPPSHALCPYLQRMLTSTSPLMLMSGAGCLEGVRLLLSYKADTGRVNKARRGGREGEDRAGRREGRKQGDGEAGSSDVWGQGQRGLRR